MFALALEIGHSRRYAAIETKPSWTSVVPAVATLNSMRDLLQDAPSLFEAPPSPCTTQAKDFVRWCCSFGPGFHNSPDITNLRYWAQKTKVKIRQRDETEILETARTLFLKKIDQQVKKSEMAAAPN